MESLLQVRDLSVRYQARAGVPVFALTGANLQIAPGEILGVVGESGSGKSTLAAAFLGLVPTNAVVEGAVFLQGKDLFRLERNELENIRGSRISLIFQEPGTALHPTIRVGAQIEEVLRAHSPMCKAERQREVRDLLNSIFGGEAERIYSSYPHQLSGGQRQRIAIAQAIVCKPSLLVADEPTAALDSVTQREILELLKRLQRAQNVAILFITHSPELLHGFADRVAVMYAGRIVEVGAVATMLAAPQHPYTRALLNCRPVLRSGVGVLKDARLPVIPGDPPNLTSMEQGCAFAPRCSDRMQVCEECMPEFFDAGNGVKARCFKFDS